MSASSPRLRTALLFQQGNFVGREYYAGLVARGRTPDLVVAVGEMSSASVAREIERTGGLWNPPAFPDTVQTRKFHALSDPALIEFMQGQKIDVAIQGGVGILKPAMIATARLGFLNVHPGRLPQYRGNSCPEWAVFNGDEVWATAHMIDSGIDTGPVVHAARYPIDPHWSYCAFRANLYSHCASVLADALDRIEAAGEIEMVLQSQSEAFAKYWPAMGADEHQQLLARFAGNVA